MANLNIVIDAVWRGKKTTGGAILDIDDLSNSVDKLGIESKIAAGKQADLDKETKKLADAVRKGDKSVEDATRELGKYRRELGLVENESGSAGMSFSDFSGAIAGVTASIIAAGVAAKQVYEIIGEGAELIAAEERFNNLAGSIGTTADALLIDMRAATGGMVSDAELIAGATDIINTGLASTAEETVRMATVIGTLGLDMDMRLDSLGLSISDVNEKTKEFQATGMSYDEAFDEAVLVLLEEKMVLLGDASETTAGQMAIVEASIKNVSDESKIAAAVISGPLINSLSDTLTVQRQISDAISSGVISVDEYNDALKRNWTRQKAEEEILALVSERQNELNLMMEEQIWMSEQSIATTDALVISEEMLIDVTERQAEAERESREAMEASEEAARRLAESVAANTAVYESYMSTVDTVSGAVAVLLDGSADASEESMERQVAANEEIAQSYRDAALAVVESKLTEALAEGGVEGEAAAAGIIALQEALGLITPAQAEKLQEIADTTARIEEVTGRLTETYLEDGELTREEAAKIAEAVDEIEASFVKSGESAEGATESAGKFNLELSKLPDEVIVRVVTEYSTTGTPSPYSGVGGSQPERGVPSGAYAAGGYVIESGSYIVGETGPERVTLPAGAHVTNAHDMRQQTYNFSTNNVGVVLAQLERQQRRRR